MGYAECDGLVEAVGPVVERLARQAIHEVDADVGESHPLAAMHGLYGLLCRVATPHELQRAVVKRLYAYTHPIEGQRAQALHILLGEVVGVGFQCYFSKLKVER